LWGTERIRGELLKLDIVVNNRSIRQYRWRGPARSPSQTWRTLLAQFVHYHNEERPHRTLGLQTPELSLRPVTGRIHSWPVLNGLDHIYERAA
jgi:transposase InsO family protein